MDVTSLLAGITVVVGLFYVIGAMVLLRHLASAAVMGEMLVALGDAAAAEERRRVRWWMVGGALLLAAGLSLVLLSRSAPLFYGLAGVFQLAWLASSARRPTQGAAEPDLHAFGLYLAFGVLVAWAEMEGLWQTWVAPALIEGAAVAGLAAAGAAWTLRHAAWRAPALPFGQRDAPLALILAPAWRAAPLRDAVTGAPVEPAALGLDAGLVERIAAWDATLQAHANAHGQAFPDLAAEQAWIEEGLRIAGLLQLVCEGALRVELSRLDAMLQGASLRCGVAEIRDAFQRLDILALSDAHDEAARTSIDEEARSIARIVARADPRYAPEIDAALVAAQHEVRDWIARARG